RAWRDCGKCVGLLMCHLITKWISGHQTLPFRGDPLARPLLPRPNALASAGVAFGAFPRLEGFSWSRYLLFDPSRVALVPLRVASSSSTSPASPNGSVKGRIIVASIIGHRSCWSFNQGNAPISGTPYRGQSKNVSIAPRER